MKIDFKTYKLLKENYIEEEAKKNKIVLCNSFNTNMNHYFGWLKRSNGNYKKTAHFTISSDGIIYQHFDTNYRSNFLKETNLNANSIIIVIENIGFLEKAPNNSLITIFGDIYKGDNISEKKWRNFEFWEGYDNKQLLALGKLLIDLCDKHEIELKIPENNLKLDNIYNYNGILYRANIDKKYTDLNPNWDFKKLKQKIEDGSNK